MKTRSFVVLFVAITTGCAASAHLPEPKPGELRTREHAWQVPMISASADVERDECPREPGMPATWGDPSCSPEAPGERVYDTTAPAASVHLYGVPSVPPSALGLSPSGNLPAPAFGDTRGHWHTVSPSASTDKD